ncbi:basic secretory protein-like protein [Pedobacter sp. B4-66]|uniref:basic secretory protein-like protein n=1 Tax=Pedobacter sp. B4-66 TaxID=2817280 RepID=UPI001BDA66A1|nr:basic secretory protein-like protein [Pedobacter sp. B4-66]
MKRTTTLLCAAALVMISGYHLKAQEKETIKKNGLTLHFTSQDPTFDPALKKKMIETFFKVYPQLSKEYNKKTDKEVYFEIDTAYDGVAATGGGKVTYSSAYFKKFPGDVDVVTHEVMHIVQNYGRSKGPGWLTEGIADYVRYKFGVDNPGAGWALPEFKSTHSYKNSYRITARFLAWLENHGNKGIVQKIDSSLRDHTYTNEIWEKETGKSLDDQWKAYSENPAL